MRYEFHEREVGSMREILFGGFDDNQFTDWRFVLFRRRRLRITLGFLQCEMYTKRTQHWELKFALSVLFAEECG